MPWQFINHYRRPFQALLYSMEQHYETARDLHKQVQQQDPQKPKEFDQYLWQDEKSESRSAFIMGIAGLEAFTNNILEDFKKRGKNDIPFTLLNPHQIKSTHLLIHILIIIHIILNY